MWSTSHTIWHAIDTTQPRWPQLSAPTTSSSCASKNMCVYRTILNASIKIKECELSSAFRLAYHRILLCTKCKYSRALKLVLAKAACDVTQSGDRQQLKVVTARWISQSNWRLQRTWQDSEMGELELAGRTANSEETPRRHVILRLLPLTSLWMIKHWTGAVPFFFCFFGSKVLMLHHLAMW